MTDLSLLFVDFCELVALGVTSSSANVIENNTCFIDIL